MSMEFPTSHFPMCSYITGTTMGDGSTSAHNLRLCCISQ